MKFDPNNQPYFDKRVDRRVCLITGGNSGIGYYTVLHMYLHGYIVYIAGRNSLRVKRAIDQLKGDAAIRRAKLTPEQVAKKHLGELKFIQLDLGSLQSVNAAIEEFKSKEPYLNVLILNAGIMAVPYSLTKDGFEIQMQTNYISHFLLTDGLISLMKNVKDPRIIFVASEGHRSAYFHFNMGEHYNRTPNIVYTWMRYGMSKVAGIQMMKTLAKTHPEILCTSIHPGLVLNTNIMRYYQSMPIVGPLMWYTFAIIGYFGSVSNEEGSYASLRCAMDPTLKRSTDNGKYFSTLGVEKQPNSIASNPQYGDEAWAWTINELNKRGYELSNF